MPFRKTFLRIRSFELLIDQEIAAVGRSGGQLIATIVEWIIGMALYPDESHLVLLCQIMVVQPKILVLFFRL